MMNKKDIPAKMLALQLKDPNLLYNCYMPFLEHGGLFVPTDDVFSLGEDILLAVETPTIPNASCQPKSFGSIRRALQPTVPKA